MRDRYENAPEDSTRIAVDFKPREALRGAIFSVYLSTLMP